MINVTDGYNQGGGYRSQGQYLLGSTSPNNWGTPLKGWRRFDPTGQHVRNAGQWVAGIGQGVKGSPIGQQTINLAKGWGLGAGGKGLTGAAVGMGIGKALPWLPVAGNVLEGDVVGAGASLAGGLLGAPFGPWGIAAGTMLGEPVVKGGLRLAGGLVGIDPNDPLSGPDWNIGGVALTPYAKTKKSMSRANELYTKYQLPLLEAANEAQLSRAMQMAKLGMINNQMSSTNQLMASIMGNNPYI